MAAKRTARRRKTRIRRAQDKQEPRSRVSRRIREAIEVERSRLFKAYSILRCLELAADGSNWLDEADLPYWPDVAAAARELVDLALDGLDSVSLQRAVAPALKRAVGPTGTRRHEAGEFEVARQPDESV